MTLATGSDRRVRLQLPTPATAFPPVTAGRLRRTLGTYALLWLIGALPSALGAGVHWSAAGLGLAFPGGGLLYAGHPWFGVVALVAVPVSVLVWWATGPVVLPPLVWLGSAVLGGLVADDGHDAGRAVALAAGPVLVIAATAVHLVRHRHRRRVGGELNRRLADVEFVVTGHPGEDVRVPVVEHSADDLARLRYALDLALQPLDSFVGLTRIDQFREAALRYQLNALSYSLSMSQFTRTPAFTGYLAEAQRNAIDKMSDRRVWGYWALENAWGNLDPRRDPVDNSENIMLTGFQGLMLAMYETLNDDRYSRPGAISYRWSEQRSYPHDFGSLAARVHRNMTASPYTLFPCEPNWIYTVCNTFGMSTLVAHDRLHGTSYFTDVEERLRHAYETEFVRPDGQLIGVRSKHLGLSWNFWAGPSIQMTTAFWMHASLPDIAQRTWWLLRETALDRRSGTVTLPLTVSARLDPGNYKLGADTYGQIVTIMAARELGDEDWAAAAQATLEGREEIATAHGASRYADASAFANLYANLGRFGRRSGLRDLVAFGVPDAWRSGPVLAQAAYPDVLVAKAVTDGHGLELVLRPGSGPVRTALRFERLVPGREYAVHGGVDDRVVASADGQAVIEIDLGARREIRIAPR